jgi:hypothetical protein
VGWWVRALDYSVWKSPNMEKFRQAHDIFVEQLPENIKDLPGRALYAVGLLFHLGFIAIFAYFFTIG